MQCSTPHCHMISGWTQLVDTVSNYQTRQNGYQRLGYKSGNWVSIKRQSIANHLPSHSSSTGRTSPEWATCPPTYQWIVNRNNSRVHRPAAPIPTAKPGRIITELLLKQPLYSLLAKDRLGEIYFFLSNQSSRKLEEPKGNEHRWKNQSPAYENTPANPNQPKNANLNKRPTPISAAE